MNQCVEMAIFLVASKNIELAIRLSKKAIDEINKMGVVIIDYKIFFNADKPEAKAETLAWQLTWISEEAAKESAKIWSELECAQALEALVLEKKYYGHFNLICSEVCS